MLATEWTEKPRLLELLAWTFRTAPVTVPPMPRRSKRRYAFITGDPSTRSTVLDPYADEGELALTHVSATGLSVTVVAALADDTATTTMDRAPIAPSTRTTLAKFGRRPEGGRIGAAPGRGARTRCPAERNRIMSSS